MYVDIPLSFSNTIINSMDIIKNIEAGYLEQTQVSKQIIVSGVGGCGKRILMKKLFLDFIVEGNENHFFIPILIKLKSLKSDNRNFFQKYLLSYFENMKIVFDENIMELFLSRGNIILLLDGLDELKFREKSKFIDELENFMIKYEKVSVVLSTRPETMSNMLPMFDEYKMLRMNKVQVKGYIEKIPHYRNKKEVVEKILNPEYYENHKEIVGHPLILAIIILTFDYNGELPINTAHFYSTVYSTMLKTHDKEKEVSFEREIKSKLSHSKLERLFEFFCFISYVDEQFTFNRSYIDYYIDSAIEEFSKEQEMKMDIDRNNFLSDMKDLLCFIIEEGTNYDFIHRSFQEYYAAKFILNLDDDIQIRFFNSEDNFIFMERGGVLNYLRMINEKKYLYTGISPIIRELISDFKTYEDPIDFIRDNVDIIDLRCFLKKQYYVMYNNAKYSTAREELLSIKGEAIKFSKVKDISSLKNQYTENEFHISEMSNKNFEKFSPFFVDIITCEMKYLERWLSGYEARRKNDSIYATVFKSSY